MEATTTTLVAEARAEVAEARERLAVAEGSRRHGREVAYDYDVAEARERLAFAEGELAEILA